MAYQSQQKKAFDQLTGANDKANANDFIAIGKVVDTNDPLQLGRIRIMVPAWGDHLDMDVDTMPWCMFVTPFGGQTKVGNRGPDDHEVTGGVAYGMWSLPNVGATAVVMCMDPHRLQRLYIGCVYDLHTTHTMPHGRWISEDHPELDGKKPDHGPYGPYSSREQLIQPLADNLQKAFPPLEIKGKKVSAPEWKTRVADYQATRLDVAHLNNSFSKVQDDNGHVDGDWTYVQGYQTSRTNPASGASGHNLDSHVYSITSPGFHSISMDDRMENGRMRIRTSSGHQILMDDTNERIYISTAQGNNWIELDQAGNIDVYSSSKISIHAAKDINLASDGDIRMTAGKGIHMNSGTDVRVTAGSNIDVHASGDIRVNAITNLRLQSGAATSVKSAADISVTSKGVTGVNSEGDLLLTSKATMGVNAGSDVLLTGANIHLNGPSSPKSPVAEVAGEKPALHVSRIPQHEPYARCGTRADDSTAKPDEKLLPEFEHDDPRVGKEEGGVAIPRGKLWRR
jgi:hypothetical protein